MNQLSSLVLAIGRKKSDQEIQNLVKGHEEVIQEIINKLTEPELDELLTFLFPNGIPLDRTFYDSLRDVFHYLGPKNAASFVARLWLTAFKKFSHENQESTLNILIDKDSRSIWNVISSFPEFCANVELEPIFAASWFLKLVEVVKDDLAGGLVFDGIKANVVHFPRCAFRILETYFSTDLNDLVSGLAAFILGTLRNTAQTNSEVLDAVSKLDTDLQQSTNVKLRICYYRSIVESFATGIVPIEQLDAILDTMLRGLPEEIDESYAVISKSIISSIDNIQTVDYGMKWLSEHTSDALSDIAKHQVVNALWHIGSSPTRAFSNASIDNLLISIQPIPVANLGTWHLIEYCLVDRLHGDLPQFEHLLSGIIAHNPPAFSEKVLPKLNYLISEMTKHGGGTLVTHFLLSQDQKLRGMARRLFQNMPSVKLAADEISKVTATEKQLHVILLEFIRNPLDGKNTADFFLKLAPLLRGATPNLVTQFKKEMILQAINYPQDCLKTWKIETSSSGIIEEVVKAAEEYFEKREEILNSPALSFSFPAYKKAAELGGREFSIKMREGVKEKSIIASMAKNVHIIYGSKWSILRGDVLGEASSFSTISSSIEIPRLEVIDPEGSRIRRLFAAIELQKLGDPDGGD